VFGTGSVNDSELATERHIQEDHSTKQLSRSTLTAAAAIGGEEKRNCFRFNVAVCVR